MATEAPKVPETEEGPWTQFAKQKEEEGPWTQYARPAQEQMVTSTAPGISVTYPVYKPFSEVRKDIDPATLNKDQDWLNASRMLYEMWERKPFEGNDDDLAEWGKDSMGYFNYNMVSMAQIANSVTKTSQENKEAFLWMMDTYDNTNMSWEGTGRFFKGVLTDPLTYVGIGTLGAGFVVREGAKTAGKQSIKEMLKQSIGRTGVTAAVEGTVYGATESTIKQGVEVSAGRRDDVSLGKVAVDATIAGTAGLVLGSAADLALTKIVSAVRGVKAPEVPNAPSRGAEVPPSVAPEGAPTRAADGSPAADAAPVARTADGMPIDRDPNLGSTLTRSEIEDATARRQKGRLEEDDVNPVPLGDRADISVPAVNTGLRSTPMSMEELTKVGDEVAGQLRVLKDLDLGATLEKLRTSSMAFEEMRVVARGIQMYADELRIERAELIKKLDAETDPVKLQELTDRSYQLENRMAALEAADDAYGSMAGSLLRQRQEGLPGIQGITVEKIMEEKGLPRAEAEKVYAEQILAAEKGAEVKGIEADFGKQIQEALDVGNTRAASDLAIKKQRLINAITGEAVPESASLIRKATEWAISQVFTVKTLFVNIIPSGIKTLMIPVMKALGSNPLEKATRAELAASYTAMRTTFKSAMKASLESYRYEQSLLTRDGNRLLETGAAIKGKFGGAVRLFPRLLNASDEFLSQINYASYVAGRAAAQATIEGTEKGLKGRELDKFIKEAVETSRKASFEGNTGDDIIEPIMAKGLNLGYSGDELFRFVESEIAADSGMLKALGYTKDLDLLRRGTDQEALDFTRDVLFKRPFSETNVASRAAAKMDETFREFPSLKLITGQLFFRTPVRVFEEGVRLTPGIQILAPKFIDDLTGKNGTLRQVRAQGEALASLGMAGMILSLYSQGRITGDGAYDIYHQQKLRGDGALQEPYTIKFPDGSTWSYRNFDPIATPMKMIVNALERHDKLKIREAQGEFIDAKEYKKAIALISVATGAISRAFIDAGLTEGINQMSKIAEMLADPANEESTSLRYVGEKLALIVPNTMKKIARDNDPTLKDPADFWQVVEQKVLGPIAGSAGFDSKMETAYSYDVLGNVRKVSDTAYLLDFFTTNSLEERGKGRTEQELFVLQEMDRLARVTGATFKPPIKHPDLGSLDLRTIMASDGKRTLYDVWQENYRSLNPAESLYPVLAAPLPDGTFKHKGARVDATRDIIKQFQDAAFQITMGQEQKVLDKYIDEQIRRANSKAGQFDTPRPY